MSVETIIWINKFIGLSTDSKPTDKIRVGSTFYETDTRTPYVWTGSEWVQDYREASSGEGGSTSPGGSTTQVQFNDANAFAGSSLLTFDKTTGKLTAKLLAETNPAYAAPTGYSPELQPGLVNVGALYAPFTKNAASPAWETIFHLVNNDPTSGFILHLLLVNPPDGLIADMFIYLGPGAHYTLPMSLIDPENTSALIFLPVTVDGWKSSGAISGYVEISSATESYRYPMYRAGATTLELWPGTLPGTYTLTFNDSEFGKLPKTLRVDGFRSNAERDSMVITLMRADGDVTGGAMGNIGTITIVHTAAGGNQTWTKAINAPIFSGTLSALSPPTLTDVTDLTGTITFEAPTGVSIVGCVRKLGNRFGGAEGIGGFGASLLVPTVLNSSDTLVVAPFVPSGGPTGYIPLDVRYDGSVTARTPVINLVVADDDGTFPSGNMHNGNYSQVGGFLPMSDGLGRKFVVTHTAVGGTDTLGTIAVQGVTPEGVRVTETVTPVANTPVLTTNFYLFLESMIALGWTAVEGTDQIKIGWSNQAMPSDIMCGGVVLFAPEAMTLNLRPVKVGSSLAFYSKAAAAVVVDPDSTQRIILDGAAGGNGKKITSPGGAGDFVSLIGDSGDGWTIFGKSGTWTMES